MSAEHSENWLRNTAKKLKLNRQQRLDALNGRRKIFLISCNKKYPARKQTKLNSICSTVLHRKSSHFSTNIITSVRNNSLYPYVTWYNFLNKILVTFFQRGETINFILLSPVFYALILVTSNVFSTVILNKNLDICPQTRTLNYLFFFFTNTNIRIIFQFSTSTNSTNIFNHSFPKIWFLFK